MSFRPLRRVAQGVKAFERQATASRTRLASTSYKPLSSAQKIQQNLYGNDPIRVPNLSWNLAKAHQALASRARDGNLTAAIDIWNKLVNAGVKPDAVMYLLMLRTMAPMRLFKEAVKVFEDMVEAGVGENLAGLNLVLLSSIEKPEYEARALKMYEKYNLVPDVTTYQYRLVGLSIKDNLESAMQVLEEMRSRGVAPNRECMRIVILLAARLNMPRLAMELATGCEGSVGSMDEEVHMGILMAGAATLNAEVTQWAWKYVSESESFPTEPLSIEVLNVACRHGLPDLALSVLDRLQSARVSLLEHHLAPLVGAYAAAGQIKEAFESLEKFHAHNVPILPETTSSLVAALSKSTTALDEGYSILTSSTRPVDVHAINTTLQAAVNLSDLPRAIGIYKEFPSLEVIPNAHTYDVLLAGCLGASHASLGERLFTDMQSRKIEPTPQTYTRLILMSLTQENYESAFVWLEEMKGRRMTPPERVYDSLVRRLVGAGDNGRAEMALEDMVHCGYSVSVSLRKFVMGEAEGKEGEEGGEEGDGEEGGREWRVGRLESKKVRREKWRAGTGGTPSENDRS